MTSDLVRAYIRDFATFDRDPLCPELTGVNTRELTRLWDAARRYSTKIDVPLPFWGIVWPGARALARYILDHPAEFSGRTVLDAACGSGLASAAAARVGAHVTGVDIDPCAVEVAGLVAEKNNVIASFETADLSQPAFAARAAGFDVILAGDVFYNEGLASPVEMLLRQTAGAGVRNLAADPDRTYRPKERTRLVASMRVPVYTDIEGADVLNVDLLCLEAAEPTNAGL